MGGVRRKLYSFSRTRKRKFYCNQFMKNENNNNVDSTSLTAERSSTSTT